MWLRKLVSIGHLRNHQIRISFQDGSVDEVDLLGGAAGIRSLIRKVQLSEPHPRLPRTVGVPPSKSIAAQVDNQSLRLDSGKVLSHRSQAKMRSQKHRKRANEASTIPDAIPSRDHLPALDIEQPPAPGSKRVAKLTARLDHHLTSMRAEDRRNIMHLPVYRQRALLAKSKQQVEYARKAKNEICYSRYS